MFSQTVAILIGRSLELRELHPVLPSPHPSSGLSHNGLDQGFPTFLVPRAGTFIKKIGGPVVNFNA